MTRALHGKVSLEQKDLSVYEHCVWPFTHQDV